MVNFFELFLSASGRAPVAVVDRLALAASEMFNRRRARGRKRIERTPAFLRSNHLRRDIGLPPVDSNGRPI